MDDDKVTYTQLKREGAWGLRGKGLECGKKVVVTLKSGAQKEVTVGKVLHRFEDGVCLAEIA